MKLSLLSLIIFLMQQSGLGPAFAQTPDRTENVQGMKHIPSAYSVAETMDRLESIVKSKELVVFARIDFAEDARNAGLEMSPKQLLIFGNPKAGTPLMNEQATVAIDLPLKALAWEDGNGDVWLSFNTPEYLQERHGLSSDLVKKISGFPNLLKAAAK